MSQSSDRLRAGGGKTKAARMRLKKEIRIQEVEKSVRFSIDDEERESIDSAMTSQSQSTTTTGRSSTRSAGRNSRISRKRPNSSRRRKRTTNDSVCSSLEHSSLEHSVSSQDKSQDNNASSSPARSSLSSRDDVHSSPDNATPQRVKVKGAGLNVLAVQDAGSHRMLLDECHYLVSTICSTRSSSDSNLWDLAILLSKKNNRSILWSSSSSSNDPLESILQIMARIPPPRKQQQQQQQDNQQQSDDDEDDWEENSSATAANSQDSSQTKTITKRQGRTTGAANNNNKPLRAVTFSGYQALAAILHFTSLDCTTSSSSSSSTTAVAARKLRRKLLDHGTAIKGMALLMLVDYPNNQNKTTLALDLEATTTTTTTPIVDELPAANNEMTATASSCTSSVASLSTIDDSSTTLSSSNRMNDPTSAGRRNKQRRRRRKRRRLDVLLSPVLEEEQSTQQQQQQQQQQAPTKYQLLSPPKQEETEERLSFTDTDQTPKPHRAASTESPNKSIRIAAKVRARIRWNETFCDCNNDRFVKTVALEALNRIIQGKEEGEETSCLDGEEANDEEDEHDGDDEKDAIIEASNPLMVTNKLLLESEALPIFAIAMADGLEEASLAASTCDSCQLQLVNRISALATLVDGACLLSDDNRENLCVSGKLVSSLLQVLSRTKNGKLLEIALISIRTLTSLTHENTLTGQQLQSICSVGDDEQQTGIEVLLQLLYRIVTNKGMNTADKNDDACKQEYDIVVFCLNTLTNVVETAHVQTTLSTFFVPTKDGEEEESFLRWLTRWIVDETSPFREGVLHGSFGTKPRQQQNNNDEEEPYLHKDAEEHLVTAGNGFILLACVMIKGDDNIRESILRLMPGGRRVLIINTLKSFCNFYYYSVGDLSVAVVAPVKNLILELERMVDWNNNIGFGWCLLTGERTTV